MEAQPDNHVVELVRERLPQDEGEHVGVGLTFHRGEDGTVSIARIQPGSTSHRSQKLGRGQQVHAINGWSVHGLSPDRVYQMLIGPERTRVQIAVGKKPENEDEIHTFHQSHQQAVESKVRFNESVQKTAVPGFLGISFDTGVAGKHRITDIAKGGPADNHGLLRVGDIIAAIDGISCHNKSNKDVKDMILGPAGSWITVEVQRPGTPGVKIALQRAANIRPDAASSPPHAYDHPDPHGVPRPATTASQHGAFLNDKLMSAVRPSVQQGVLAGSEGQQHLLMEHTAQGVFSKQVTMDAPELVNMPAGAVQVSLFYASHLPVKTLFGLSDCYVQATYEGKRLRSPVVRFSLDPKFNTTMRFPAGDCVNALTLTVLQVGGIGSDLEIGHVTLPYRELCHGVNKEFALFGSDGAAVVGLKNQTSVLYVRAAADMLENDVGEVEHRRAEREWAAQAMALQQESKAWPGWLPSEHAHKYKLDPTVVDQEGLSEGERSLGLTLRLEESFEEAKRQERVFAQHLVHDLATATDASRHRFQYVGIEQGSVLATVNVRPSHDRRDTRTAMNVVSEITVQAYDPSSKLRRLPCTYTVRGVSTHPPRKPPSHPTWGIRNWIDAISTSAPPPEGPVDGHVAETDLGGEQKPVFGATAALPVMTRVAEAPVTAPVEDELPAVPQQPMGFLAAASVLDNVLSQSGVQLTAASKHTPEPRTVISNRQAVEGASKEEAALAQQRMTTQGKEGGEPEEGDANGVAVLFNSLMTSFAGRAGAIISNPYQVLDKDCEVKLLVKQAKHIVGPRARSKVYFCASLLAVGAHLEENVTHQVPRSAHIEALPPEALARTDASPLAKYQLVAQYRSHLVGVESDLVTFEWQETVKMRECIAGIAAKEEPAKQALRGQPVQLLLTLHGSDVAAGDDTLGWTLVPIAPDTEVNHWFPLMDTSGQIKNVDRQQSRMHISYSYAGVGERGRGVADGVQGEAAQEGKGTVVDRSMVPNEVVHAEKPPEEGSVGDASVSVVSSVPRPRSNNFEFAAVKNAVRAIKALSAQGYELVLVGQGDVATARKALVALQRFGVVDGESGAVKLSNLMFVDSARDKAEVAKQLGGLVGVVDSDWEALRAVAEEVESGTQCVLFSPSREARRKYLEAVMQRDAEDAELAGKSLELAQMRQRLRQTELGLARVGVDMRAQSRYTPKEEDPQVKHMVEDYVAEEIKVVETAERVKLLLGRTASPLLCVPTARNERGLVQKRKPDGWEEACESLGLDAGVVRVYDERPKLSQILKPSPADPPPFFPLALSGSQEALLRMPQRVEAWEMAKRKGAPPMHDTCGVGITVGPGQKGELVVTGVEYGGPAFLSRSVAVGDVVVSIDGEVLLGVDARDVKQRLQGKVGTVVLVEVLREGEDAPLTVVLERKERAPAFRDGKGRILIGLDGAVLYPQVDDEAQKGGRVQITVGTANHLPRPVNTEALFCLVKVSPATNQGQPTVLRSDLVPVSPPPFSSCLFDAKFEADVDVLSRQKVTVELYWPDPHKQSGVLLGSCGLSASQLVAGKGTSRWLTVLAGGSPVKGVDNEECKIQLAGEIVATDATEKLLEDSRKSKAMSQTLGSQETVGVSLVLDEDFNSTVGLEDYRRQAFANELKLDLAAALYTSEDRFQVCGLQPGSVTAHVNILQDLSGADAREPKALAKLLTNQVVDASSPLHWARTTRNAISITMAAAFKAPSEPGAPQRRPSVEPSPGTDRELAPRERAAGVQLESEADRDRRRSMQGAMASGVQGHGPVLGKPESELTHKERQGASLNALADGMMRSKEPALFAEPAVVALTFNEQVHGLETPQRQAQIHADLAVVLFLPVEAIETGGFDVDRRTLDVVVFPFSAEAAAKIRSNMELARKMVPGVQHMIAAQLVSQVFDKASELWNLPGLDCVEWAQVLRAPRHDYTKQVIRRMKGEDVARDPTGGLSVAAAAARQQQQAAVGGGLQSPAAPSDKVWVPSPTLGMVWEELTDRTGEPYWVNHKEKLVAYSHPQHHWPLPPGWTQHVDDRRRVYYSAPNKQRTQWEHPCSPTVVYGVLVQGHSATAMELRDWVQTHGWKDLAARLNTEPWAKDLQVEHSGARTRVLHAPPGQTKRVVAAFSFQMKWEDVPMKERGMQPLPPPAVGEEFVTLDANMVALMMTQYPAGYYMVFCPSVQRVKPPAGFTTVWVTCQASDEVVHRKVTVVGGDTAGAHPGFQGKYQGWAITEVEEAWRVDPAQMQQRGLMFSSLALLLQTHPEEFRIRVDPTQEIPTCRFVRQTWAGEELQPGMVDDPDALSRPLVRQPAARAEPRAGAGAVERTELGQLSPEVQEALVTMGSQPQADAIGGLAEQEAAAFAAGLSEVDIQPMAERPGFSETTLHLRRGALRAGNKDGLAGIGVVLQALHNPDDPYMVVEVEPTGPAGLSQQVEVGDILLAVDSYQTRTLTLPDVIQRIKGPPFAPVTLLLRRKDKTAPFE